MSRLAAAGFIGVKKAARAFGVTASAGIWRDGSTVGDLVGRGTTSGNNSVFSEYSDDATNR